MGRLALSDVVFPLVLIDEALTIDQKHHLTAFTEYVPHSGILIHFERTARIAYRPSDEQYLPLSRFLSVSGYYATQDFYNNYSILLKERNDLSNACNLADTIDFEKRRIECL